MTDITEILDTNAKSNWAMVYEHDCWIERASEEIKRLRAEIDQYENIIIPSWKREERIWRESEARDSDEIEKLQKKVCRFKDDLFGAMADQARLVGANLAYKERIERAEVAMSAALDWIESADHKPGCPRIRDYYECTCGRDAVIQQLYGAFEGAQ